MNKHPLHRIYYAISLLILFSFPTSVLSENAPTDAQLLELEREIEQQEMNKKRAADEAKRKAEEERLKQERKKLESERRLLEEEKRKAENIRKQEKQKQIELDKKRALYDEEMKIAHEALKMKDKEQAIIHFNNALNIYPGDKSATIGIQDANKLMAKVCYEVIGTWEMKEFIGSLQIRVMENGIFHHGTSNDNPTSWECLPEKRQLKEKLMNSTYTLNPDGTCLSWEHRDPSNCFIKLR